MSRLILGSLESQLGLGLRLGLSTSLKSQTHALNKTSCFQCVRFYRPRKPFWLPIAKTKMFRIPKHPDTPENELEELKRLYNVYRTQMKSIRQYFKERLMAQTTAPEVIAEQKRKLEEQHAECIKENYRWNAEVATLREERLAREAIQREEYILQKIMDHERKQKERIAEIDAHVRLEKEAAKSFITPANIDEAIENALNNVLDFNFCIDKEGNIYKGRYGKPSKPPKKTKEPVPPQQIEQDQSMSLEATN